ncbi:MAG: dTMP kinase [Desulfovibrio sp.]|jgi:dTMP kinase|nr:dTMP kinase [Desulfovibrio sp.]
MFITFEGIEGSGKTSVLDRLCPALSDEGISFVRTREPGGSELGRALRAMLLDGRTSLTNEAELFLYLADRAQHARQVIAPALERGDLVISDRYIDSTLCYQGHGRGMDLDRLIDLNNFAVGGLWPDLTLIFDLDPEISLKRARRRNIEEGIEVTQGRYEAERLDFHRRIRRGYLALAEQYPQRCRTVDASRPFDDVYYHVTQILEGHGISLDE